MTTVFSSHPAPAKATDQDLEGRFREILSDPLNLLIERDPFAGFVNIDGLVSLHNGLQVPTQGSGAYYGDFSRILVLNRGVHEPLEEFVFQEMLKRLPWSPVMVELGAYWGHYSMWLKKRRPGASVHLVEPDPQNLQAGIDNFRRNGLAGEFVQGFVAKGQFGVDSYLHEVGIHKLDVLHADVQGFELDMLESSDACLRAKAVDYIFISTHSQVLHEGVLQKLKAYDFRIEVSSDFDTQTTSFDGFVFASSPQVEALFEKFEPLGRVQLAFSRPCEVIEKLAHLVEQTSHFLQ